MTGYPPERHVVLQRGESENIARVNNGSGLLGQSPPPKRHASYPTVTLAAACFAQSTAHKIHAAHMAYRKSLAFWMKGSSALAWRVDGPVSENKLLYCFCLLSLS